MAADPNDPLIGRRFDRRYTILRKLGSGGMAEVYLAEDDELGRQVALKMLNERHARDEQFVERFKREARNAARLSHPHIVRIYDRGQAEGTYYISMEYLERGSLRPCVRRKGRVSRGLESWPWPWESGTARAEVLPDRPKHGRLP